MNRAGFAFVLAMALTAHLQQGCRQSESGRGLQEDDVGRRSTVVSQTTPNSSLSLKVVTSAATKMKLVLIPAGEFEMGNRQSKEELAAIFSEQNAKPESFDNEYPWRRVKIWRPFYMGLTEVTQAEWQAVMGSNPSYFSESGRGSSDVKGQDTNRFPVEQISWYDAAEYCNLLSEREGFPMYYDLKVVERNEGSIKLATVTVPLPWESGYRLPTEAEWEYACRAGTTTAYHSGNSVSALDQAGWYGAFAKPPGNSDKRSHPVMQKTANPFGLFDMHGNVEEWCQDVYDFDGVMVDMLGRENRVLRGGSWSSYPSSARSASRRENLTGARDYSIGFRIARNP